MQKSLILVLTPGGIAGNFRTVRVFTALSSAVAQTLAQVVKIAIESGVSTQSALVGTHARKTASQSAGFPAVWKFPDGSRLEIFGRGTSREVRAVKERTP